MFVTGMVSMGHFSILSQPVLVPIAGIIYGRPILDVSLTPSHNLFNHATQDKAKKI